MLRLGMMRYINTLPFRAPISEGAIKAPFNLILDVPTAINHALRTGAIDLGLISTAEYLQHRHLYTLLPYFSITGYKQVQSVMLYLKGELCDLNGAAIALTPESASSVLLLRLFCRHFWHVTPEFVPLDSLEVIDTYQAILLCGDTCLRHPQLPGFHALDMAQIWYHATGLVFPFAVFAVRNELVQTRVSEIKEAIGVLKACLDWSSAHPQQIERIAMLNCSLPRDTLRAYYASLRFAWGQSEQRGMERFASLLEDYYVQTVS